MTPRVTRWVAPGVRIKLAHATHTTGNRDGWWLVVAHAGSGIVIREIRVDLDHPQFAGRVRAEVDLARALLAIGATPA